MTGAATAGPEHIIALAGLQLTRKALFTERARLRGYAAISVGDYVRSNLAGAADYLSEQHLLERVLAADEEWRSARGLVIDSVKSQDGVRYLRDRFRTVAVVACLAPLRQRWHGAAERNRADAPATLEAFVARDDREIAMGLAEVIIRADFFFLASDPERSATRAESILNLIERGDG